MTTIFLGSQHKGSSKNQPSATQTASPGLPANTTSNVVHAD
jgi:hypothetical protein